MAHHTRLAQIEQEFRDLRFPPRRDGKKPLEMCWHQGRLLVEAKALMKRGHWMRWQEHTMDLDYRTANRWMLLYKRYPNIADLAAFKSMDKALVAARAAPRKKTEF